MKREILFKGKYLMCEWVYGSLIVDGDKCFIYPLGGSPVDSRFYGYEVDPETVCQFIGLNDKNGAKMFDGDIISLNEKTLKLVDIGSDLLRTMVANISELGNKDWLDPWQSPSIFWWQSFNESIEVVGNIFDNPELLK